MCIDGGWVPVGHPLASDYLARPLVIDYTGTYTLTLLADDCTGQGGSAADAQIAPAVVKQRVYTAQIEQIGATLQVSLSGADFLPGSGGFYGVVVSADQIRFPIGSWDWNAFDVAENIAGIDGDVVVSGSFRATTAISGGRMNGAVSENEGLIYLNTATGWDCAINRFELIRQ